MVRTITYPLLFFCSLFIVNTGTTIAQSWEWLSTAGGFKSDKATTIALDDAGNTYITGYYNEEADFGPINTGFSFQQSKEVFVAKLDPQGNFLWATNALNYYDDRGLGLCLDPQGNAYVTGTCWGGLDWPPLNVYNSTSYTDQIFVTKIDPSGNVIWMKNAGVDQTGFLYSDDHGHDIISDSQGNLFVTGFVTNNTNSQQNAQFDAINIPLNSADTLGFVAKLSNDGVWQWVETFGGIYQYRDNGIGIDDEDNVYVAGGFKGTRTFGTDVLNSNYGSLDIFVVKYDNAGNYQYVVQVGDSLDDRADGITYGNDGHMYVTGEFRGEVYFGTDDLNNYGDPDDKDIFVSKMTKDGEWIWATKAGSKKGSDRGIGICANDQGNIFVSGQFRDVAKFGSIEVDAGADSIQFYVAMINSAGLWQWVLDGGGPYKDRAASVACDNDCNLYVTGYFYSTATVDTFSLSANGLNDIFIGKIVDACDGNSPPPGPEPEPEDSCAIVSLNVFSPNNDNVNDLLVFSEYCNIESTIVILNRWGNIVYESDDILLPWDGTDQFGNTVQDGVYFYQIDLQYSFGVTDQKSGFITVVR